MRFMGESVFLFCLPALPPFIFLAQGSSKAEPYGCKLLLEFQVSIT